jgi:hypothetical protein
MRLGKACYLSGGPAGRARRRGSAPRRRGLTRVGRRGAARRASASAGRSRRSSEVSVGSHIRVVTAPGSPVRQFGIRCTPAHPPGGSTSGCEPPAVSRGCAAPTSSSAALGRTAFRLVRLCSPDPQRLPSNPARG